MSNKQAVTSRIAAVFVHQKVLGVVVLSVGEYQNVQPFFVVIRQDIYPKEDQRPPRTFWWPKYNGNFARTGLFPSQEPPGACGSNKRLLLFNK